MRWARIKWLLEEQRLGMREVEVGTIECDNLIVGVKMSCGEIKLGDLLKLVRQKNKLMLRNR